MSSRPELDPESMVLDARRGRIDEVISHRTRTLTVVLDKLEDNFNMAAVIRTCEAMGLQEVHVVKNPDFPWQPHPRVSLGCEKWIDLVFHETWWDCSRHLRERGFKVFASAVREDKQSVWDLRFDEKVALVFGNERLGVSEEALATADGIFWIPMLGFTQSLNVSAAVCASVSRAVSWRLEHLGRTGDLTDAEAGVLTDRFLRLSVKQAGKIFGDEVSPRR